MESYDFHAHERGEFYVILSIVSINCFVELKVNARLHHLKMMKNM